MRRSCSAWLWSPLGWIGAILTVWVCYFFRDPPRVTPLRDGLVVSPADGRVSLITTAVPPAELDLPPEPMTRISVFMNVFDCHVNRSPVTGRITQILYTPGLFLNAELDKASEDNERNALVIETGGTKIGVVQIAGLVARRIVSFVKIGDHLSTGERFGLIRFGSRARHLRAAQRPGSRRPRPDGDRGRDGAGGSRPPTSRPGSIGWAESLAGREETSRRPSDGTVHSSCASPIARKLPSSACPSGWYLLGCRHERPFPALRPGSGRAAQAALQAGAVPGDRPNIITLIALCLGL